MTAIEVPTKFHAVGRRKTSVARVYLKPGSGKWEVNGRTLGDYFPRPALVTAIQQPFTATDMLGRYDVKANINGGGQTGQSGALRLAVARALVKIDETHRRKLRDLGLLTRDAPRHRPRAAGRGRDAPEEAARRGAVDPRSARRRAQEARPPRRSEAVPVQQAVDAA